MTAQSAIALIQELRQLGNRLEPGPNGKLFAAPAGKVSNELRARLIENKPEILAHLRRPTVGGDAEILGAALAMRDVLQLEARLLRHMPVAATLVLAVPGIETPIIFTCSRPAYDNAQAKRWPAFLPSEYEATCLACENGRAFQRDLAAWCAKKATHPTWRLTEAVALAGLQNPDREQSWSFGRLLRYLNVQLRMVQLETQPYDDERGRLRGVTRETNGEVWGDHESGLWPLRGPTGGDA